MLPRHASIADTIIPIVFYAIPHRTRLRYVLKRELLLDPCLDIVGNRLPNCFVARTGEDAHDDVERITTLARGAAPDEGFLIYPEGTRVSAQRRQRILERLASRVDTAELARMRAWTELLPPRPSGTLALLAAAPNLDLVFCAHSGFEGASHFSTLINGSWTNADVHIHFWRIPRHDVPRATSDQREFLFAQWDRMQATVVEMQRARSAQQHRKGARR
jgi:1-acyl-sn-glycerol-3-phosphate acyltransferase